MLADQALAQAVADHKSLFFAEKASDSSPIDYGRAVRGELRLVPEGAAREALARDYARMVDDGLLLDEAQPFEALMESCKRIADEANARPEPS